MKCPKAEYVSAYFDGEMGQADRTAFQSHIQTCSRCSAALEELQSLRSAFSAAPRHQAPYAFSTRVAARAAALKGKKSPWFSPAVIKIAEAAVLLIVITVGVMAGKVLIPGSAAPNSRNLTASFSLDVFDPTPPDSLGGTYLAMTEAGHER